MEKEIEEKRLKEAIEDKRSVEKAYRVGVVRARSGLERMQSYIDMLEEGFDVEKEMRDERVDINRWIEDLLDARRDLKVAEKRIEEIKKTESD